MARGAHLAIHLEAPAQGLVVKGAVRLGVFPWILRGMEAGRQWSAAGERVWADVHAGAHHSPFFGRRHGVGGGSELVEIPADGADGEGGGGGEDGRVLP